jgi:hypothetical protein
MNASVKGPAVEPGEERDSVRAMHAGSYRLRGFFAALPGTNEVIE